MSLTLKNTRTLAASTLSLAFVLIVRPLPGRPVRDTPRGSCAPLVRGTGDDLDVSGCHDASLISGVGLGRLGLLGEEVGVLLERRFREDLFGK